MSLSDRLVAQSLVAICLMALALALVAQFVFGLRPCELCLIQRGPFVIAALLAAWSLRRAVPSVLRLKVLRLAGLVLLLNGAIAVYHVGVEQHWWESAVCPASTDEQVSVEDLMAQMNKPVEVHCDQPAWSLYGITMAAMNIPFSTGLGLAVLVVLRRRRQEEPS